MGNTLGSWSNAPLALVLAQVQFEPVADWALLVDQIAAEHGDRFGERGDVRSASFTVSDNGQVLREDEPRTVACDLRRADQRHSLRIHSGALTLSTSSYKDSPSFLAEWNAILGTVFAARPSLAVTRIGLRYIDFIIPAEGKEPEDYFAESLARSPSVLGEPAPAAVTMLEYPREHDGGLRIHYACGFGPPSLPPELSGPVVPPPGLVARFNAGRSATLDLDRWQQQRRSYTAEPLAAAFQSLRDDVAATFHKIINDEARAEWGAGERK